MFVWKTVDYFVDQSLYTILRSNPGFLIGPRGTTFVLHPHSRHENVPRIRTHRIAAYQR